VLQWRLLDGVAPASARRLLSRRAAELQWDIFFATARSERHESAQECHDGDFFALHCILRLAALVLRAPLCPMPINAQGSIAIRARKSVDKARMPRDLRAQTGAILPLVATNRRAPGDAMLEQEEGVVMAGQRPRQGGNKHDGPCWLCRLRDGPQPPQVQCMRWQTRCMPSTTQRLGTKRHTRQVKADRQPRYTPDRPKLQVRTTWQSRPTLRPAGCAMRGGAASPTAPQATRANSQLRSLRIAMRPKERC